MQGSPPAEDVFLFEFFGGPTLSRHGELISLSPMQGALLALIHTSKEVAVVSREEVLGRLWPREDPYRARRRLSQLMYSIHSRTAKCRLFQADGEWIRSVPGIVRTDLQEFFQALESDRFDQAWKMLSKGFLPLLETLGSKAFCEWREARAAELRGFLRKRGEGHYRRRAGEGDWGGAAEAAEVLVALHPNDERPLRDLLTALWRAGKDARASEVLREFAASMEAEEGRPWSPEPATLELLSRMQAPAKVREPTPAFVAFRVEEEPPLIGRDRERTLLRKTLRTPPSRDLRTILLLGEAGVGKTRMVWEGIEGLEREGQRVLTARAVELERIIPLNPLIEAFAPPGVGAVLRELEEPWRTVLYGIMPHHYLGKGPVPTPPEIQPGSVPRRLFEAVYQLLLALSAQSPLVLVVDDVQWADETTLAILQFLVRRWENGSFQLVLSLRPEELQSDKALSALLETLHSEGELLEVELGDLDERSSEDLVLAVASRVAGDADEGALDVDEVRQIRSLGTGNPLFLIELTTDFLAGRVSGVRERRPSPNIPRSLRQLVERRLARLGRQAQRVLGALAVTGRPFSIEDLGHIAALSPPDLLSAALDLAELNLTASQGQELYIRHELIRQTVYRDMDQATRSWLHRRVAEHLAATRTPPPVDELALHYSLAGVSDLARRYALEAAPRAESAGAIPEALGFLTIAREHSPDPAERDYLAGRMGHLNYLHQNLVQAADLLEVGVRWARQAGEAEQALFWEAERVDCLGQTAQISLDEALAALESLRHQAAVSTFWEAYQDILDIQAHFFHRKGDLVSLGGILAEAEKTASLGPPAARSKALSLTALNIYFGDPEKALPAAREAVRLALETSDNRTVLNALNRLIIVLSYRGLLNTPEGQQAIAEAERQLASAGDLLKRFNLRLNLTVWKIETGDLDGAELALLEVAKVVREKKPPLAPILIEINTGELFLERRAYEIAERHFRRAEGLVNPITPPSQLPLIQAGLGLCAIAQGRLAEAKTYDRAIGPFPDHWSYDPTLPVLLRVRLLSLERKLPQALDMIREVSAKIKNRFLPSWLRLILEEARLLRTISPDTAVKILEAGLRIAEELNLTIRAKQFENLRDMVLLPARTAPTPRPGS